MTATVWDASNTFPSDANGPSGRQEFVGSPTYQIGSQSRCKRVMYCPWDKWDVLVQYWFVDPDLGSGKSDPGPMKHPLYDHMFAVGADVEPFAGANSSLHPPTALSSADDINIYDQAKVTFDYQMFPDWTALAANQSSQGFPAPAAGTQCTFHSSSASELLCIPGRLWKWSSDSVDLPHDVNPGVKIMRHSLTMKRWFVINPSFPTLNGYVGCVNDAAFMGYDVTNQNGCVLFHSYEYEYIPLPYSTIGGFFNLTYHFLVRQAQGTASASPQIYGWNYFYRRDIALNAEAWGLIKAADGGRQPYPSKTFSNLFTLI